MLVKWFTNSILEAPLCCARQWITSCSAKHCYLVAIPSRQLIQCKYYWWKSICLQSLLRYFDLKKFKYLPKELPYTRAKFSCSSHIFAWLQIQNTSTVCVCIVVCFCIELQWFLNLTLNKMNYGTHIPSRVFDKPLWCTISPMRTLNDPP